MRKVLHFIIPVLIISFSFIGAVAAEVQLNQCREGKNMFDLAIDLDYNPHIVYTTNSGTYYIGSLDGGTTWSTPYLIDDYDQNNNIASIAVDGSNRVHIVWEEKRGTVQTEIYHIRSLDHGLTWSSPQILSNSVAYWSAYPNVACYNEGVHVVWVDDEYNQNGAYIRNTNGGDPSSWESRYQVTNVPSSGYLKTEKPAIVADIDGVHIGYIDDYSSHDIVYYIKSSSCGASGSWASPITLTVSRQNLLDRLVV